MGDISRDHTDARFRVHAAVPAETEGVGLVEILAPDVSPILLDLADYESVFDVNVLAQDADDALVQFRTRTPLLLTRFGRAHVPVKFPISIVGGEAVLDLMTSSESLARLRQQLERSGIRFSVNQVCQKVEIGGSLSDSQLRLIRAAVEQGYYDTPRNCSLTELASDLDLASSTVSVTLHRAEEKIIKQFVGGDLANTAKRV